MSEYQAIKATMKNGSAETDWFFLSANRLVGVFVPTGAEGVTIKWQGALPPTHSSGLPQPGDEFDCVKEDGSDYSFTLSAGKVVPMNDLAAVGVLQWARLVSTVSQTADRDFWILTK